MNNHRTHPRVRQRRLAFIATFIAVFALASGGVSMAATGYARMLKAAPHVAPQAPTTINAAPQSWQPPGCVFPAASAFSR